MALLRDRDIAYKVVPEEKLGPPYAGKPPGGVRISLACGICLGRGCGREKLSRGENPLVLILDHLTDVRNFGAIVRTAECAGVCAVVIPSEGSAPVSADAVKASAGAIFRVPLCKSRNLTDTAYYLQQCGLKIICATEKTADTVYSADMSVPLAVVMGNEEKGISKQLLKMCDQRAKLPLEGEIGSLNVSAACAAVLYEAVRQRSVLEKSLILFRRM